MSTNISPDLPPERYRSHIVPAIRLERFDEPSARAIKIKGYAADNRTCFYFHTWTLFEERFDSDDAAYQLATYSEQVIAWRLQSGKWVRQKRQENKLKNGCRQKPQLGEPEEVQETDIAR
ncbi:MAG: hypothetical protein H6R07_690 [Proteobacteria bacterium]|nr:hypothetical protein [Pseudomonadota bacterium]